MTVEPEVWATANGHRVPVTTITHWRCPHCDMLIALDNQPRHRVDFHLECWWCDVEEKIVRHLLRAQELSR